MTDDESWAGWFRSGTTFFTRSPTIRGKRGLSREVPIFGLSISRRSTITSERPKGTRSSAKRQAPRKGRASSKAKRRARARARARRRARGEEPGRRARGEAPEKHQRGVNRDEGLSTLILDVALLARSSNPRRFCRGEGRFLGASRDASRETGQHRWRERRGERGEGRGERGEGRSERGADRREKGEGTRENGDGRGDKGQKNQLRGARRDHHAAREIGELSHLSPAAYSQISSGILARGALALGRLGRLGRLERLGRRETGARTRTRTTLVRRHAA